MQALTKLLLYIMLINVILVKKSHMDKLRVNVGGDDMKTHTGKHDSWEAAHITVYQKGLPRTPQILNGIGGIWTWV